MNVSHRPLRSVSFSLKTKQTGLGLLNVVFVFVNNRFGRWSHVTALCKYYIFIISRARDLADTILLMNDNTARRTISTAACRQRLKHLVLMESYTWPSCCGFKTWFTMYYASINYISEHIDVNMCLLYRYIPYKLLSLSIFITYLLVIILSQHATVQCGWPSASSIEPLRMFVAPGQSAPPKIAVHKSQVFTRSTFRSEPRLFL